METLRIESKDKTYKIEAQDNHNPYPKYKSLFLSVERVTAWSGASEGFAGISRDEAKQLKDYIEEWLSHAPERKLREVVGCDGDVYRVAKADRPLRERGVERQQRSLGCPVWQEVHWIPCQDVILIIELLNNPYEGE